MADMIDKIRIDDDETLDPGNWYAMRALGHQMVDDMVDYLKSVRERPVWQHAPDRIKVHFTLPPPLEPQSPEEIYQEFCEYILPYPIGNIHPRFWGWVFGTGTVMGAYADLLAASMNTNSGDLDHHSAIHVETQVLNWLKGMLGYPTTASGLLTSGCSMANLLALTVARNAKAGFDMRRQGIRSAPKQMILYTSEETHSSIQKAVELLGLGSDSIRNIPVNEYFQINLEALKDAIVKDRENGFLPFCVVGAAGTVNTGAIDDLEAIADICQLEDLWFHIDGAFGAWAILSANANNLLAGMGRSDSLAFDLHKWMYMPYDIGCVLVRNARAHRDAFSLSPVYISRDDGGRGLSGGDLPWLTDYDFHLSRGFRALKAWMSLKEHGIRKYGRMIQKNLDQAQYLAKLIESAPELELAAPVPLNIVCFHYVQLGLEKDEIDRLNRKILVELQEQGIAVLSGTMVTGRYVLRAGITNHRSHRSDFELLVEQVIKTGDQVVASYSP